MCRGTLRRPQPLVELPPLLLRCRCAWGARRFPRQLPGCCAFFCCCNPAPVWQVFWWWHGLSACGKRLPGVIACHGAVMGAAHSPCWQVPRQPSRVAAGVPARSYHSCPPHTVGVACSGRQLLTVTLPRPPSYAGAEGAGAAGADADRGLRLRGRPGQGAGVGGEGAAERIPHGWRVLQNLTRPFVPPLRFAALAPERIKV